MEIEQRYIPIDQDVIDICQFKNTHTRTHTNTHTHTHIYMQYMVNCISKGIKPGQTLLSYASRYINIRKHICYLICIYIYIYIYIYSIYSFLLVRPITQTRLENPYACRIAHFQMMLLGTKSLASYNQRSFVNSNYLFLALYYVHL